MDKKQLVKIQKEIVFKAIDILEKQGFKRKPFSTSSWGWNYVCAWGYELGRLVNSDLQLILLMIVRGERRIRVVLNIFKLEPFIDDINLLQDKNGIKFLIPPNSYSKESMGNSLPRYRFLGNLKRYTLRRAITPWGKRRNIKKLEKRLLDDLGNVDDIMALWYKYRTPNVTDWEGNIIVCNNTLEQLTSL